MEERKMICDRCRASVPISNMNYVPKGKDEVIALCVECREQKDDAEKASKTIVLNKKPYYCYRCKYKFMFDRNKENILSCPYCGKKDQVGEHKPPSASKLIDELR